MPILTVIDHSKYAMIWPVNAKLIVTDKDAQGTLP